MSEKRLADHFVEHLFFAINLTRILMRLSLLMNNMFLEEVAKSNDLLTPAVCIEMTNN